MYDNNVMKVVKKNIPADANIIGTKWVFAEKDNKKKKGKISGSWLPASCWRRFL